MVALSTNFVRGFAGRLSRSLETAVDTLERSDATAVVLDAGLDPAAYEALAQALAASGFPVLAVEAPCPRTRASSAQLCSIERDESDTALAAALDTLRRAARLGARFVVLRLGEVRAMEAEWRLARERFLRDDLGEDLTRRLMQQRRAHGVRPLDVARRVLDPLARAAEAEGLTLAVANGRRFTALPDARELELILDGLEGAPVSPLFDVPAAHLPDVMGFQPFALTQAAFGQAPLVYLGDACGPLGALPPGRGQLDVGAIARALLPSAEMVFSPWSGLTVDESLSAVTALAKLSR